MTKNEAVKKIASRALGIIHMEPRDRDGLDFHDLSVWQIREALEQAYDAGREAARDSAKGAWK